MKRSILLLVIGPLFASFAFAGFPHTISYQGVLTDNAGVVVPDGNYSMVFKIYGVDTGGTEIWSETQSVAVVGGRFNVILGGVNPLDIPFDESSWLEIKVESDPAMSPRIQLAGAPYSLNARTVEDSAITSGKIADGQVVRSVNGATDDVVIQGGTNVTVQSVGNTITISSALGIPTTTRYFTMPPEAFTPNNSGAVYARNSLWVYSGSSGIESFAAPAHLPHGATVTEVSALVEDTNAAANINISLRRISLVDGSFDTVAAMATTDAFDGGLTTITDSFIQNAVVDGVNYVYSVQMSFDGGAGTSTRFRGLRITYEIDEPLP
jgi:hypothetical protein